jgi:cytochrome oxidase assembly protein ShyY1
MTFSIAHIFGHNSGMQLIAYIGYEVTWYIMGAMLMVSVLFLVWLRNIIRKEK